VRLRTLSVVNDADVLDLDPVATEQLRVAGKSWDGNDLEPAERLDGEIEGTFGTLEHRVLADTDHERPMFDVLRYAGDAGIVFRAGTIDVVAMIAYGIVETRDRHVSGGPPGCDRRARRAGAGSRGSGADDEARPHRELAEWGGRESPAVAQETATEVKADAAALESDTPPKRTTGKKKSTARRRATHHRSGRPRRRSPPWTDGHFVRGVFATMRSTSNLPSRFLSSRMRWTNCDSWWPFS